MATDDGQVTPKYTKEEINLLWSMLTLCSDFISDGKERRYYYRGHGKQTYATYEDIEDTVNGSCFSENQICDDLEIRMFLKYVPLEDVPMFIDSEHPLSAYAQWRLKIGR